MGSSGQMGGELFKRHWPASTSCSCRTTATPPRFPTWRAAASTTTVTNASVAYPLVQERQKLRALAITSKERVPFFPACPP